MKINERLCEETILMLFSTAISCFTSKLYKLESFEK